MYANLSLSGGAHLCIPFVGFLKAVSPLLHNVRNIAGVSGGALVATAWVLQIPEKQIIDLLIEHISPGIWKNPDITNLIDNFGMVDSEEAFDPMITSLLQEGVANWKTFRLGWPPDDSDYKDITFKEIAQLTGKNLVVTVCDLTSIRYLSSDTAPELPVRKALRAACAVPFVFTPVKLFEEDTLFCDACVMVDSPVRAFPNTIGSRILSVETSFDQVKEDTSVESNRIAPKNILEYGKAIVAVISTRLTVNIPDYDYDLAVIPRWTPHNIRPVVEGLEAQEVSKAYNHGFKHGKDFLNKIKKNPEI